MADPWDEFFIGKINEGLSASSQSLASEEEELLRTPVEKLGESPSFSPEAAQQLQAKCIGALTEAYARDTAGKNRQAALRWRENNDSLYKYKARYLGSRSKLVSQRRPCSGEACHRLLCYHCSVGDRDCNPGVDGWASNLVTPNSG
jgi:hypothetical protein